MADGAVSSGLFDSSEEPISFKNFKGTRPVNTPTSLRVCRILGVLPMELVKEKVVEAAEDGEVFPATARNTSLPGIPSATNTPAPPEKKPLTARKAALRRAKLDEDRRVLVDAALKQYRKLDQLNEKKKADKLAESQKKKDELSEGGSVPRGKAFGDVPVFEEKSTSPRSKSTPKAVEKGNRPMLSPRKAADAAVDEFVNPQLGQFFLILKQTSEDAAKQDRKLKAKQAKVERHAKQLHEEKETKMHESARKFEEKRAEAKRRHDDQVQQYTERALDKMRTLDHKIQSATLNKRERGRFEAKSGTAEREAWEKQQQARLAAINAKVERANAYHRQRLAEMEETRQLKSEVVSVKGEIHARQQERMLRALEYKKEEVHAQVTAEKLQHQEEQRRREEQTRLRGLQQEYSEKIKREIGAYVEEHKGQESIPVPPWLDKEVAKLSKDRIKRLRSSQSFRRMSMRHGEDVSSWGPTATGAAASSRAITASAKKSSRAAQDGSSSIPHPPPIQEKFSVWSPSQSPRQIFAQWMYD